MSTRKKPIRRKRGGDASTLVNQIGQRLKALAAYFDANADQHEEEEIREVYGFLRQTLMAAETRALLARQTSAAFEGRFVLGETELAPVLLAAPQAPYQAPAPQPITGRGPRLVTSNPAPSVPQAPQRPQPDPVADEFGITEMEME